MKICMEICLQTLSVLKSELLQENCEPQGTDNGQGQNLSNGGYCVYPLNTFHNMCSFDNYGINITRISPVLPGAFDAFRLIAVKQKYLMDYYQWYLCACIADPKCHLRKYYYNCIKAGHKYLIIFTGFVSENVKNKFCIFTAWHFCQLGDHSQQSDKRSDQWQTGTGRGRSRVHVIIIIVIF